MCGSRRYQASRGRASGWRSVRQRLQTEAMPAFPGNGIMCPGHRARQCPPLSVVLHGSGRPRRLRLRPASITMGRVGQGSTPMPVAPMLTMKLIPMAGPWIVLSSCTAQGNWYTHAHSDREHLHPRRLHLSSPTASVHTSRVCLWWREQKRGRARPPLVGTHLSHWSRRMIIEVEQPLSRVVSPPKKECSRSP